MSAVGSGGYLMRAARPNLLTCPEATDVRRSWGEGEYTDPVRFELAIVDAYLCAVVAGRLAMPVRSRWLSLARPRP